MIDLAVFLRGQGTVMLKSVLCSPLPPAAGLLLTPAALNPMHLRAACSNVGAMHRQHSCLSACLEAPISLWH